MIVTVVCALGAAYLAWAQCRVSESVISDDMGWPRPAPYPDRWLVALNDWYDVRYPVKPGYLKIHGELPRVRLTVGVALVTCLLGTSCAMLWWARHLHQKRTEASQGTLFSDGP
jgi:hypothetical protein